ncbi:class IV adenylate cyclase [Candidatus Pacearchaeota archaeon CG_4_9_14_0_2_um_filter_39_13]|nr:class IV adenylate cyclase [Candidatus Pacearchaeota archaeon]OIO43131.1 MAG: hypothetical protein AUJ64_03040 [Candidatus Pacearchaeota archaeon CG1_02_39_14]PJC44699.1 MAG: class IV adenylate cyclase [Candidatus Pacearchaeota archaeon CG_4_9_14_0_2_um_filter_39_13]
MNEEVEIKVALKNPEEVEARLKEIAKFVKEKEQKDEYFTPKHEDFFALNPPVEYLRVRHEDGKDELHYNFLHFDDKKELLKTDEYEVPVGNPEMMSLILSKLDMINKVTVTKHRKTYDYKGFEVCLDFIKELGHYIEVEAKKFDNVGKAKEECYAILDELGADWDEIPLELRGYPIMVLAKQGEDVS